MAVPPVEAAVLDVVREVLADPDRYAEYAEPLPDSANEREMLQATLTRIEAAQERWAQAYESHIIDIDEFKRRRLDLDAQSESVAAELQAIARREAARAAVTNRLSDLAEVLDDIDEYEPQEVNQFLRLLIARVDCIRGQPPRVHLL